MLIMMEPHLGLACGKVNITHTKNVILMHVIVFFTEVSCAYVYVCPFLFCLLFLTTGNTQWSID